MILCHWAPTSRRKRIERMGLMPGSLSRDRLWRPPYVCFANSPSLGWALSGGMRGNEPGEQWDLWMVHDDRLNGYEVLAFDDDPDAIKEVRVYERIYKRDLWYVGSRFS